MSCRCTSFSKRLISTLNRYTQHTGKEDVYVVASGTVTGTQSALSSDGEELESLSLDDPAERP